MTFNRKCQFSRNQLAKIYFVAAVAATILLYNIYNFEGNDTNFLPEKGQTLPTLHQRDLSYSLNTSVCKIPESDPYSEDIVNFLRKEKYSECSSKHLLTYVAKNDGIVTLNVNRSVLKEYSIFKIDCCYSNITRIEKITDRDIKLTDCVHFEDSIELNFPYVKVTCSTSFAEVYVNVHATTLPPIEENEPFSTDSKYSVLLLGIDSMSKANLKRTMPTTHSLVEKTMINLKGYNKIGDNTFPNLMAILTGYSLDQLQENCNKTVHLNTCNFVWDTFKSAGYRTAYGEDECSISTFNFDRPGFLEEPTDYYYHPYFVASEKLKVVLRANMVYCTGPETSGERILNAAKDFSVTFKNVPSFGLFWSNSFSHDDVNMPAVMDGPFHTLLSDPDFVDSLNRTIFIFFSDHGFRFGDIRYTHTGWLEERLPFIYVRVPDSFKNDFPEKYSNLLINSDRLTTPWDVFNTFQDILKMQDDSYTVLPSPGCPKCRSLFTELPENRTCEDACISQHWCTCRGHSYVNPNNPRIESISRFVVSEINRFVRSFRDGGSCTEYNLKSIKTAGVSESILNGDNESVNYFLVMIETTPSAIFEATVEESIDSLKLLGEVSRLDQYKSVTECVRDGSLKKFCYCEGFWAKILKIFW